MSDQKTEQKHTPGPWSTEVDRENAHEINIVSGNRPFVATAWPATLQEDKEQEANARLIAAAPELLEALRVAEHSVGDLRALEIVRAAIAKATNQEAA